MLAGDAVGILTVTWKIIREQGTKLKDIWVNVRRKKQVSHCKDLLKQLHFYEPQIGWKQDNGLAENVSSYTILTYLDNSSSAWINNKVNLKFNTYYDQPEGIVG